MRLRGCVGRRYRVHRHRVSLRRRRGRQRWQAKRSRYRGRYSRSSVGQAVGGGGFGTHGKAEILLLLRGEGEADLFGEVVFGEAADEEGASFDIERDGATASPSSSGMFERTRGRREGFKVDLGAEERIKLFEPSVDAFVVFFIGSEEQIAAVGISGEQGFLEKLVDAPDVEG